MKRSIWVKIAVFLFLVLNQIPDLNARPGMGGSYRSSSSSSFRSSSSSYKSSNYRSSNSTSSSNFSNSVSYSPSPTAYFSSTGNETYIHFNADGSAHVREIFTVEKSTAIVGIVRKKLPILFDWKIKNLKISPDKYTANSTNLEIDVNWNKGTNDQALPLEINYDIVNAVELLGNLPIVYWSIEHNSSRTKFGKIEVSWDPSFNWKSFSVKQKVYNQKISDYEELPIRISKNNNSISLDITSLSEASREILITAFLESKTPNIESKIKNSDDFFNVKQISHINLNGSNQHQAVLSVHETDASSWKQPSLDFGIYHFLGNPTNSFHYLFYPRYQITYGTSGDIKTSFWHISGARLTSEKIEKDQDGNELKVHEFSYSKVGEQYVSDEGKKQIIKILPARISYEDYRFGSLSHEIILPDEIHATEAKISLFLSNCSYCDKSPAILALPVEIGKDGNRIYLNWDHSFPKGYFPLIQLEIDNPNFSRGYFLTYIAAIRSFFIAPGAGTNSGYLVFTSFLFLTPFFIGLIYFRRAKNKILRKRKKEELIRDIRQFDSHFQMEDFLLKTKTIAEKIVTAWTSGDMETARHFISAGVFQRFQIQLKLLNEIDQMKNLTKDFQVLDQTILLVNSFNDYITIHVKLTCQAQDLTISNHFSESEIESHLKQTSTSGYEEIYSFSRKKSAHTQIGKDLIHNICPSCGSDSPFSHMTTKCKFCGSIFNSGEFDWVLSEITQTIEWDPKRFKTDESFSSENSSTPTPVQILEDRASALLWKWIYAKSKGSPVLLKREICNPQLLENLKKVDISYIPVVGSAEIEKIFGDNNDFIATCNFRWSAARAKNASPEHRRNSMKLRLNGKRLSKLGFGELGCKNCGAPLPEIDSQKCSYCSESIPDLVDDWLLEEIN